MISKKKELTAQEAKEKALRLLEFRAHSQKELWDKLIRSGAKKEDIEPIMEFLKEYNFINDTEYAKSLARDLQNLKKLGKRRIRNELWAKGINSEDIDIALSELPDDDKEELLPMVERKLGGNFEKKNVDRAIRYFLYRGYDFEDVKSCIERLKADFFED